MVFSDIPSAVEDVKDGKIIIIVDDESRENEGDLVFAAEKVTSEKVNFMITHGKGLVCMPIIKSRLEELDIPLMTEENTEVTKCQFTVSVDHKDVSTGISAADRALTVKKIIDKETKPNDLLKPGHMFPLKYNGKGVIERQGHTEASVDIVKLAGLYPAAVICEMINEDGTMARLKDLEAFSSKHGLKMISIRDLVKYLKK